MIEAIVYTSNTGHTRAYAKMLGVKTGLPVLSMEEAGEFLKKNAEIIYMGWLFASNVRGYPKAFRRYRIRCVCGVGLGDTGAQDIPVRKATEIPDTIPLFTLQGGMDYSRLTGINKFMIDMLTFMLSHKTGRTEDETKMLALIQTGGYYVDETHLSEVLSWYEMQKEHV